MRLWFQTGLVLYALIGLLGHSLWAADCGTPYRLELKQPEGVQLAGKTTDIGLYLSDDSGKRVFSCQDLSVQFQVTSPDNKAIVQKVVIPEGKSEINVPVMLSAAGIFRLEASQKRLYPATLHLVAKNPEYLPEDEVTGVRSASIDDESKCAALDIEELMKPWTLLLRANPKENVLANGKDTVTIQAFITGDQPYVDQNVEIILDNTGGNLSSSSISIPRCKNTGEVQLTSRKTGAAVVSFVKSTGIHMQPEEDKMLGSGGKVEVTFLPPVKAIELKANKQLSRFDEGTVVVRLVNEEGYPVPTVVERMVTLRIFGNAKIESRYLCADGVHSKERFQLCIPPNETEATVKLLPQSTGIIRIEAHAPNIGGSTIKVSIVWSILYFILAGLGGLALLAVGIMKFRGSRKSSTEVSKVGSEAEQPLDQAFDQPKTKILLLAANPQEMDTLRLAAEFREIKESLKLAKNRSKFELVQGAAIRPKDLRRMVLDEQPHIIHFSGHGSTHGICLEDDRGHIQIVSGKALAGLFRLFDSVQCVILNACYSEKQAKAIVKETSYVIGMNNPIGDKAAIRFSIGFYDALGANREIEEAFAFGVNAIELSDDGNHASSRSLKHPQLNSLQDNKNIPVLLKKNK